MRLLLLVIWGPAIVRAFTKGIKPATQYCWRPTRPLGVIQTQQNSLPDPSSDPSYWESLYTKRKSGVSNPLMEGAPSGLDRQERRVETVEVVSFDLDDTLWPGKTIIDQANRALDEYLRDRYPLMVGEGRKSVAAVMGALARQYPDDFLEVKGDPSSVVRFTDLRKLALSALAKDAGYEKPDDKAEECFNVWIDARHDVERLLYPGTLDLLRGLRDRGLRLCAITNGNCDVMRVPCLAPLIDFCVNAENVGARKRTGRPYEAAFSQAGLGALGPRWVHVGDDFTEDMAAAKAFNVRTIWFRTKEKKAEAEAKERLAQKKALDGSGPVSLSDLAAGPQDRYFQDKEVIRVSGTQTDDYLSHFITKEFVDAEAETMQQLEGVIDSWLKACRAQGPPVSPERPQEDKGSPPARTHKFCVACGEKLVVKAKFCSACGEPQE